MIQLQPHRLYKIRYGKGTQYTHGTTRYFETLDSIPLAKHLIQVKEIDTGEIIDLTDLLAHPWLTIEECLKGMQKEGEPPTSE